MNWCVIIPTYNNEQTLEQLIHDVLAVTGNIIVVNDGSTDGTLAILERFPDIEKISYGLNRGKGYALRKGFERAMAGGFDYAVTVDSDGQHYASEIPLFTAKSEEMPDALIVGARDLPPEIRKGSSFANKFSNFWFRIIAGVNLPDTQSGFRLYPLKMMGNMTFITRKYEFELEVLYRCAWKGIALVNIPVRVYYPPKEERISHFRPFRDFVRISILNAICFLVAFFYVRPFSFLKYLRKESIRNFLKKNLLQTGDSVQKLTFSVMFGVFMGIVPIWGYQLITAIALAYLFRLNKLIVIVAANISIPPMIPLILYLSYITGGFILASENQLAFSSDISFAWVRDNLFQYVVGAVVFAVIAAVLAGLITLVLLKVLRKRPALLN